MQSKSNSSKQLVSKQLIPELETNIKTFHILDVRMLRLFAYELKFFSSTYHRCFYATFTTQELKYT